jgi:hypothetical protein
MWCGDVVALNGPGFDYHRTIKFTWCVLEINVQLAMGLVSTPGVGVSFWAYLFGIRFALDEPPEMYENFLEITH